MSMITNILLGILNIGWRYVLPFLLAYCLLKILGRVVDSVLGVDQTGLKKNLAVSVVRSLVTVLVWATAVFAAMNNIPDFSDTWQTVLTSASVASVVLGLAAQDTLANVFAGISMSIGDKPFAIGDRVQIGDIDPGYVVEFTLRHVEILTYAEEHIYVPNSVAANAKIVNYSRTHKFSHWMYLSVAYEADIDRAMEIMREVMGAHPKWSGEGTPWVIVLEAAASGVTLRGMMTTERFEDNAEARSDCLREIMKRYVAEGIEIPYNKLVVLQNHNEG